MYQFLFGLLFGLFVSAWSWQLAEWLKAYRQTKPPQEQGARVHREADEVVRMTLLRRYHE